MRMPAVPTRVLAVFAFALVAAACSSAPADTATGEPTGSTPATTASPSKGGGADNDSPAGDPVELLNFDAPLLGGGTFDGTSLAGKDVAFWFWAPW